MSVKSKKVAKRLQTFGINMRIARKNRGLTSMELAKLLDVSTAYIGLLERSERTPSVEVLLKICDFFGKGVDDMMASGGRKLPKRKGLEDQSGLETSDEEADDLDTDL